MVLLEVKQIGKPTKCFLSLSTQKIPRSDERKSNLNHKKVIISQLLTFPRLKPVYKLRTPRRKAQEPYQKYILFTFLPAFPKGTYGLLPG